MSVLEGKAENICSRRVFRFLTRRRPLRPPDDLANAGDSGENQAPALSPTDIVNLALLHASGHVAEVDGDPPRLVYRIEQCPFSGKSRKHMLALGFSGFAPQRTWHRQKCQARNGLMACVVDLRRRFLLQNPLVDNRPGVLYFVRAGSCSLPRRRFSGSCSTGIQPRNGAAISRGPRGTESERW